MGPRRKIVVCGAAGRDFHNFNIAFRDRPDVEVVAFTHERGQNPDVVLTQYPAELAGPLYPHGVPIEDEGDLAKLLSGGDIAEVVFAYSDVAHTQVMHLASQALAAGASFRVLGPLETALRASLPVLSVTGVRTGSGKSHVTWYCRDILRGLGLRVGVLSHPMPYGDLVRTRSLALRTLPDLEAADCSLEEREEWEPHLRAGVPVFAGVDYADVLAVATAESDVLIWEGGNNDQPFLVPDLDIVTVDPHRAGHEIEYFPGEANLRRADVLVLTRCGSAPAGAVAMVRRNVAEANPAALVVEADAPLDVDHPERIAGRRVLVIEDAPSLTHGGMVYGAGMLAARVHGATAIVDPRPFAVGAVRAALEQLPNGGPVLPTFGYTDEHWADLQATIAAGDYDTVVLGTQADLDVLLEIERPVVRVRYTLEEGGALRARVEAFAGSATDTRG